MDLRRLYLSCHKRSSFTVGSDATKNYKQTAQRTTGRRHKKLHILILICLFRTRGTQYISKDATEQPGESK